MRIAVSATTEDMDSAVSPVFGRCPFYLFVDTDTMEWNAVANPAAGASGGAGIQAAQFIVEQGAQALLTGNVGPNAMDVLNAAGVSVYPATEGTVREAVEAFRAGDLQSITAATVHTDAGKSTPRIAGTTISTTRGRGAGLGAGRGAGQGLGRGAGQGLGRGSGRGMGRGGGAGRGRCGGGRRGG